MKWLLVISVVAGMAGGANAQQIPDQWEKPYYHETVAHDRFDRDKWEEITGELDYTEEGEEAAEHVEDNNGREGGGEETESSGSSANFRIPGAEFILFGVGILVIAVLLYFLVFKNLSRSGKKVRRRKSTLEEVEQDLEDSDVDPLLSEAIKNGHYHLAIRLYYLKCIQELSFTGFITWQRDKTNGEYLRELHDPVLKADFRYLTLQFELAWYGEYEVDRAKFDTLEEQFSAFLASIENRKNQAA